MNVRSIVDQVVGVATLAIRHGMLPPFIIEQIRKREIEERRRPVQPQLELPVNPSPQIPSPPHDDENKRGVIIVEL